MCLAAIRKWQLDHDGDNPDRLAEALSAIGIDRIPVDAYCGRPLQMFFDNNEIGIFSVGPDGDDDQAKIEFNPYVRAESTSGDAQNCDVIYRLKRRGTTESAVD